MNCMMPRWRAVLALVAVMTATGLAACSSQPKLGTLTFDHAALERSMFRITSHWRGAAPADLQEQMLAKAAEVARSDGGSTYSIASADFEVTNTAYLTEGSPRTPVMLVAPDRPREKPKPGEPPTFHAQMVIQVYRQGQAPEGARLYDVAKIERDRSPDTSASRGSVGFGVGAFHGMGNGGVGVGVGVQN
ncbi:MAG TPA: hypothetical protein VF678_14040 [bacterium]